MNSLLLKRQDATVRVYGAWVIIYFFLSSKTYSHFGPLLWPPLVRDGPTQSHSRNKNLHTINKTQKQNKSQKLTIVDFFLTKKNDFIACKFYGFMVWGEILWITRIIATYSETVPRVPKCATSGPLWHNPCCINHYVHNDNRVKLSFVTYGIHFVSHKNIRWYTTSHNDKRGAHYLEITSSRDALKYVTLIAPRHSHMMIKLPVWRAVFFRVNGKGNTQV